MHHKVLAAGGTIVLALRLASRFLQKRNEHVDRDLFFPDDEAQVDSKLHFGESKTSRASTPLISCTSVSGLDASLVEHNHRNSQVTPKRTDLGSLLGQDNLQVLVGNGHASGSPTPGESTWPSQASDWTMPADLASISSGEARRRAASVRKVRDWDDLGGSVNWAFDPDGSRIDNGSSSRGGISDEDHRRSGKNGGSAAQMSDESTGSSPRQSLAANGGAPVYLDLGKRSGGGAGSLGTGSQSTMRPASGRTGASATYAGLDAASGLAMSSSSMLGNCSRGSGTDASVPYRSCGTGTATLTSSSSPNTSHSTELQELRCDTDSDKVRQQQYLKRKQEQQQQQLTQESGSNNWTEALSRGNSSPHDGHNLVAEVIAAGKDQQAKAVARAASAKPILIAAMAASAASDAPDSYGWQGAPCELPLALRSASPPLAPPPPPLPPTIVMTRSPNPQSLLDIQRQVDALQLQHLQRQAQALLAAPAASCMAPRARGSGSSGCDGDPAGESLASLGRRSNETLVNAGGGTSVQDQTFIPTMGSHGSSGGGSAGQESSPGVWSDSWPSQLPPELRRQVDQLLQDMAQRQQHDAPADQLREGQLAPASFMRAAPVGQALGPGQMSHAHGGQQVLQQPLTRHTQPSAGAQFRWQQALLNSAQMTGGPQIGGSRATTQMLTASQTLSNGSPTREVHPEPSPHFRQEGLNGLLPMTTMTRSLGAAHAVGRIGGGNGNSPPPTGRSAASCSPPRTNSAFLSASPDSSPAQLLPQQQQYFVNVQLQTQRQQQLEKQQRASFPPQISISQASDSSPTRSPSQPLTSIPPNPSLLQKHQNPQAQHQPPPSAASSAMRSIPDRSLQQQQHSQGLQSQSPQGVMPPSRAREGAGGTGRGASGAGGFVSAGPEALLCSLPSFRHQLVSTDDPQQLESVRRTQDWLNSTSSRVATHGSDRGVSEEVPLPVLRPHPPPQAEVGSVLRSGGAGDGSFPSMRMHDMQSGRLQQLTLQHRDSLSTGQPLGVAAGTSSSVPSSPLLRQNTSPSRHSTGIGSSHGSRQTSGHGSRRMSTHGTRLRESTAARLRREALELQEKVVNLPPPSALGLISARMLQEAGEQIVPAPRSPGGRAFFVPLKHEVSLAMSEQPSSILSGSQTSM